ncbi:MAG: hypothetical protein ABI156_01575, partial [Caldimonas sp.]
MPDADARIGRPRLPAFVHMSNIITPRLETMPDAAPLPEQIGKYRVLGRLGDGATSEVFLAFDDFKGCNVAIKRVRPSV